MFRIAIILLVLMLAACSGNQKKVSGSAGVSMTQGQPLPAVVQLSGESMLQYKRALKLAKAHQYPEADKIMLSLSADGRAVPWQVFANHGIILLKQDRPAQAEGKFRQALKLKLDVDIQNYLALALRQQGHFRQAERVYLSALGVDSRHAPSYKNLAILYEIYLFDYARAKQYYQKYAQLRPTEQSEVRNWLQVIEQRAQVAN